MGTSIQRETKIMGCYKMESLPLIPRKWPNDQKERTYGGIIQLLKRFFLRFNFEYTLLPYHDVRGIPAKEYILLPRLFQENFQHACKKEVYTTL